MFIDQKILFIIVLLVILFYCYYINLQTKGQKLKEGFDTELGDIVDTTTDSHKIKKLIETEEVKNFSIRLWDNHSRLKGLYPNEIPKDRETCSNKDKGDNIDCPLGIWRPTPSTGYISLGDVATTSFMNPSFEKIADARTAKTPGDTHNKNIDTIATAGAALKEPIDYIYVGGFGDGKMLDRLEKNEEYYRLMKQIKFYGEKLVKISNDRYDTILAKIKKIQNNINDDFGIHVNQLIKANKIKPISVKTLERLKRARDFGGQSPNSNGLNFLLNQKPQTGNIFMYDVREKIFNYKTININPLINSLPPAVSDELRKSFKYKDNGSNNGSNIIKIPVYSYVFYNLKIVDDSYLKVPNKNRGKSLYFGNETSSRCFTNTSNRHSKFITKPGVQMKILHNVKRYDGSLSFQTTTFGNDNSNDEKCLIYHNIAIGAGSRNDVETLDINSIQIEIHPKIIPSIFSDNYNNFNENLKGLYDGFNSGIKMIKKLYPDISRTTYRRLSIWQPIAPEGYIPLGFVFTNDPANVKPGKQTITCVPQNCAKNFKRRKWDPKLDLIFRYKGEGQQLAFYRNPFLSTIVVMDEKKENGIFKNKTPEILKCQNIKDSLRWECYDIVPCIEECDYVKRLEDADNKSRGICKAYRGLEGQHFEKLEYKKTTMEEEKKLRELVKTRQTHITTLMEKLNKMMSEEELYKLINNGMNRYNLKVDLQNQRKLHGQVADKLMKTRGIEINWNAPEELNKFKELLKRYVIAQYTVQGPKRDCPVCKLPEDQGFIKMENLEMCYGCLEDVVRELVDKKKAEGKVPEELKLLQDKIDKKTTLS